MDRITQIMLERHVTDEQAEEIYADELKAMSLREFREYLKIRVAERERVIDVERSEIAILNKAIAEASRKILAGIA